MEQLEKGGGGAGVGEEWDQGHIIRQIKAKDKLHVPLLTLPNTQSDTNHNTHPKTHPNPCRPALR